MKNNNSKKELRIGRVYHIKPTPIPPFESKEREAVFVGRVNVKGFNMPVFIQMGSSKYHDNSLENFNSYTKYFWQAIKRKGYFHIAVSKPEVYQTIINVYTNKGKNYVDMKKRDAVELFNL